MHRKFQLHTKKAELFNIIWKLHPSCDSATLQQYPWASCSLVQFPGNLCVLWCLPWEKSHHKHQRGSVLALGLWPGCLRTFQLSFHTHSDLPAAVPGSTTLQRERLSSHRAALQEPGEQRDPLWSWAWAGGWKHSLAVVQRGWPDNSEPGWWKGWATTGARDGREAPQSCFSREQTCGQGENRVGRLC